MGQCLAATLISMHCYFICSIRFIKKQKKQTTYTQGQLYTTPQLLIEQKSTKCIDASLHLLRECMYLGVSIQLRESRDCKWTDCGPCIWTSHICSRCCQLFSFCRCKSRTASCPYIYWRERGLQQHLADLQLFLQQLMSGKGALSSWRVGSPAFLPPLNVEPPPVWTQLLPGCLDWSPQDVGIAKQNVNQVVEEGQWQICS